MRNKLRRVFYPLSLSFHEGWIGGVKAQFHPFRFFYTWLAAKFNRPLPHRISLASGPGHACKEEFNRLPKGSDRGAKKGLEGRA